MGMFYKKIDLSHARNVYVVGDIHGMFGKLDEELGRLGFDDQQDHLLSVGDLVDRGPDSIKAIDYIVKPWFNHVRGNHEQLVEAHVHGHAEIHTMNGGNWFKALSGAEKARHNHILNDAPIILEVITPSGKNIGVIHANIPTRDWNDIHKLDDTDRRAWTEFCLWSKEGIQTASPFGVANIHHIYFGHIQIRSPYRMGNCSWIDTKAYKGGPLTIIRVD